MSLRALIVLLLQEKERERERQEGVRWSPMAHTRLYPRLFTHRVKMRDQTFDSAIASLDANHVDHILARVLFREMRARPKRAA